MIALDFSTINPLLKLCTFIYALYFVGCVNKHNILNCKQNMFHKKCIIIDIIIDIVCSIHFLNYLFG